jgi:hypothetical protein
MPLTTNLTTFQTMLGYTYKEIRFLRFDSGLKDNNRFLIYVSEFMKALFPRISTVLVDGTFWSVPSNFLHYLQSKVKCLDVISQLFLFY